MKSLFCLISFLMILTSTLSFGASSPPTSNQDNTVTVQMATVDCTYSVAEIPDAKNFVYCSDVYDVYAPPGKLTVTSVELTAPVILDTGELYSYCDVNKFYDTGQLCTIRMLTCLVDVSVFTTDCTCNVPDEIDLRRLYIDKSLTYDNTFNRWV